MKKWTAQDAKVHFSDFLDTCVAEGSHLVTNHKLQASSYPSLKQLLLSDVGRTDLVLPERGQARRRLFDP
jgi:antitoxin Phd